MEVRIKEGIRFSVGLIERVKREGRVKPTHHLESFLLSDELLRRGAVIDANTKIL